jgi:predicted AlkP superfamily pyrophosphatase or phosphodiesterase
MVTAMDDAIGNVTESLKHYGLYDDTLIIFTADVSIKHCICDRDGDLNCIIDAWFFCLVYDQ